MNPIPVVAVLAYQVAKSLFGGSKLRWAEVDAWIKHHANRNNYGRGYAENRLPSQMASNGFIELRKEQTRDGAVRVIASAYLNPKALQPAASKTWVASKLDTKLQEQFGKDLRVRINI